MFEGSTEPVQLRSRLVCSEPIDRVKVVQKNKGIGWREGSCLNVLSIPCIFQTNSNANLHHSFSTLLFFILNPFPSPSHPLWRSGSHPPPPPPPPPPVLLSRNHLQTLPPSPFPSPSLLFVPKPTLSKSQRNKSIAYHLRRMPTSPSSTRTTSTVDAKAHASPTSLGSSLSLLPSASPLALLLLCSTLL